MATEILEGSGELVPVRYYYPQGRAGEFVQWEGRGKQLETFVVPDNTPPGTVLAVENPTRQGGVGFYLVLEPPKSIETGDFRKRQECVLVEALIPERVQELKDEGTFNPIRVEPQLVGELHKDQ